MDPKYDYLPGVGLASLFLFKRKKCSNFGLIMHKLLAPKRSPHPEIDQSVWFPEKLPFWGPQSKDTTPLPINQTSNKQTSLTVHNYGLPTAHPSPKSWVLGASSNMLPVTGTASECPPPKKKTGQKWVRIQFGEGGGLPPFSPAPRAGSCGVAAQTDVNGLVPCPEPLSLEGSGPNTAFRVGQNGQGSELATMKATFGK